MSNPIDPTGKTVTEYATVLGEEYIPAVPVTQPTKAFVGAVVGGVTAAGATLVTALGDNVVSGGEWITLIVSFLVGSGLIGTSVYATVNKPV